MVVTMMMMLRSCGCKSIISRRWTNNNNSGLIIVLRQQCLLSSSTTNTGTQHILTNKNDNNHNNNINNNNINNNNSLKQQPQRRIRLPNDGLNFRDFISSDSNNKNNDNNTTTNSIDDNNNDNTESTVERRRIQSSTLSNNNHNVTNVGNISRYNNDENNSSTLRQQHQHESEPVVQFHIKTYGCQMNVNDSDIVRSILCKSGIPIIETSDESVADILLTNTCAIREGAEKKVWHRLKDLRSKYNNNNNNNKNRNNKQQNYSNSNRKKRKIIGVLGCMAERLKADLLQDGIADLVVGPDAYRDLPNLLQQIMLQPPNKEKQQEDEVEEEFIGGHHYDEHQTAVNVQLSNDETYADITPIRRNTDEISAFVSIQRGCSNRCSFCIVPFTRGVERSRPFDSIIDEIKKLHFDEGVREVTLLGQNVNSYHDTSTVTTTAVAIQPKPYSSHNDHDDGTSMNGRYRLSNDGFRSRIPLETYNRNNTGGYYFADLLHAVSDLSPDLLRVRFTSPHPKNYPPELLALMSERSNICNHLHMPAQSGSTSCLKRMKRGYTREAYLQLIHDVRNTIPDVAISSDFITGFCNETEEEHADTVSLMQQVRYDQAFMFAYSMRGKTHAQRTMEDNVPEKIKQRRLREIIDVFHEKVQEKNTEQELGRFRLVLLEGVAKKRNKSGELVWTGRTDQNKRILIPIDNSDVAMCWDSSALMPLIHDILHGSNNTMSDSTLTYCNNNSLQRPDLVKVRVQPGDYAAVQVTDVKGHTLRGKLLWRTNITEFYKTGLSRYHGSSLVVSTIGGFVSNNTI